MESFLEMLYREMTGNPFGWECCNILNGAERSHHHPVERQDHDHPNSEHKDIEACLGKQSY